jgi:hypothetical protein
MEKGVEQNSSRPLKNTSGDLQCQNIAFVGDLTG